ncbi:MAG: choice-of-anchor Q domain-containing protein [Fimbriiglobus sp.]
MRRIARQLLTKPMTTRRSLEFVQLEDRTTPAIFTVTNTNDTGAGSLRQAILDANAAAGADDVIFDASFATAKTITLQGEIAISQETRVIGPGENLLTIANGAASSATSRIFNLAAVPTNSKVTISSMKLTGGNPTTGGGAIYMYDEDLTLSRVIISGNRTDDDGGAINSERSSNITILDSTISGNVASDQGGGIYFYDSGGLKIERSTLSGNTAGSNSTRGAGGGIYFFGTATSLGFTITNSTISGNKATNSSGMGGGIAFASIAGNVNINSTTITDNSASKGGGISRVSSSSNLRTSSTIIAQNSAPTGPDFFSDNASLTASTTLIGVADGITFPDNSSPNGTLASPLDAKLNPLADNGGPTQTHSLRPDSPAINRGSTFSNIHSDQRGPGYTRPWGNQSDIGSFEIFPIGQPNAFGITSDVKTPSSVYTFKILYSDVTGTNRGIDPTSIINNNDAIEITSSVGFTTKATYVGIDSTSPSEALTATYQFTPPDGMWDFTANGRFFINIVANQIKDIDSNFIPNYLAGDFGVAMPREFVVTNTDNSGPGSLRQAVIDSNRALGIDKITFAPLFHANPQVISIQGQLSIFDAVHIIGPGSKLLTISEDSAAAGTSTRIMNINYISLEPSSISGLSMTGGELTTSRGAGLLVNDEALTLNDVRIFGNKSNSERGGGISTSGNSILTLNSSTIESNSSVSGGGIEIERNGTLILNNSSILSNTSTLGGGGIFFRSFVNFNSNGSTIADNVANGDFGGGGILSIGKIGNAGFTIVNSTISGNKTTNSKGHGAGLSFRSVIGNVLITNSTITNNQSSDIDNGGGGISRSDDKTTFSLVSSVLAGNSIVGSSTANPDVFLSTIGSAGIDANQSFIGSSEGLLINGAGNLGLGTNSAPANPMLSPLADNGGPTLTHSTVTNSPLRDSGSNPSMLISDQRGLPRVFNGRADIGSFEFSPPVLTTTIFTLGSTTTNAPSVVWLVTFPEPVQGVSSANFQLLVSGPTGTSISEITSDFGGRIWRVTANTGDGEGTIALQLVNSMGILNLSGEPISTAQTTGAPYNIDKTPAAIVSITRNNLAITNLGNVSWTVVLSEPVTGVDLSKFALAVGIPAGQNLSQVIGSGTTYIVTATTGTANTSIELVVNLNGILDLAGNMATDTVNGPAYTIDKTQPVITLSTPLLNITTGLFEVTVTLSETATGLTTSDIQVTNGSVVGLTKVDGTTYTYQVQAQAAGPVSTRVANSAVNDAAGNVSAPSNTLSVQVDPPAPTMQVTTTSASPTRGAIDYTVTFSEPVTGFVAADIGLTNATVTNFIQVDGTTYTFRATPIADGNIGGSIPAGAGLSSLSVGSTAATLPSVTFDSTRPTTTISIAAGQANPSKSKPLVFAVNFSEPVTGFDAEDLKVTGPGELKATVTGSGANYLVSIDGAFPGTITVSVNDDAALDNVGNASSASGKASNVYDPPLDRILVGSGVGNTIKVVNAKSAVVASQPVFDETPQGVRVATGDFNRDGIEDFIVGTGPGVTNLVRVLNGKDFTELFSINPFEENYTGGVYVAGGDLDGDGVADLAISADVGGGPRVRVFSGATFAQLADFLGIDDPAFRGGARVAMGDMNKDGFAELTVAAGFGGGPRVSVYDGRSLVVSGPRNAQIMNFFAFENTLRNGTFVAMGDLDGDGASDLILGGGPGGGPRVTARSGVAMLANRGIQTLDSLPTTSQLANFFGGDATNRGGVRVSTANLDGDNKIDLVLGAGVGAGSRVTAYYGRTITTSEELLIGFELDTFEDLTGGVYVG